MPSMTPLFDSIVAGRVQDINRIGEYRIKDHAPHIICADGEKLSVQASHNHYCSPRNDFGPYTKVEVGYPSVAPPETWARYFDGDWSPEAACGSVYGYIPVELVREFILEHGGEKEADNA